MAHQQHFSVNTMFIPQEGGLTQHTGKKMVAARGKADTIIVSPNGVHSHDPHTSKIMSHIPRNRAAMDIDSVHIAGDEPPQR